MVDKGDNKYGIRNCGLRSYYNKQSVEESNPIINIDGIELWYDFSERNDLVLGIPYSNGFIVDKAINKVNRGDNDSALHKYNINYSYFQDTIDPNRMINTGEGSGFRGYRTKRNVDLSGDICSVYCVFVVSTAPILNNDARLLCYSGNNNILQSNPNSNLVISGGTPGIIYQNGIGPILYVTARVGDNGVFGLGSYVGSNRNMIRGSWYEMIIFNRVLDIDENQFIIDYLELKYGL